MSNKRQSRLDEFFKPLRSRMKCMNSDKAKVDAEASRGDVEVEACSSRKKGFFDGLSIFLDDKIGDDYRIYLTRRLEMSGARVMEIDDGSIPTAVVLSVNSCSLEDVHDHSLVQSIATRTDQRVRFRYPSAAMLKEVSYTARQPGASLERLILGDEAAKKESQIFVIFTDLLECWLDGDFAEPQLPFPWMI
ncbi:hypothetical protein FOZ60_016833 [Perkinsus olseni]|uniref:Uncharacterized protein n=1 Tax=Perkinsus olseni TaxID=32597 RepID=A0A7J6N661_PEROL|nr:hypothetical protein FOZ60_016833 [Perkinsus olseni]KAF4678381.1 hypothetical protein FOZ62_010871 [Perkinsus olseni]